jgi:N-acetylneuraminate synthase
MSAPSFSLGGTLVGPDAPVYFIADLASNHDGDLDRAFRLIELARAAGADAAKFQNFQAPRIVSRRGFERLGARVAHQAAWKRSVYEVYEDASVDKDWTPLLKAHCDQVGIQYLTSPYDLESVDLADPHVPAFKIGSGDITFDEELAYIAGKGKPVLLATGASTLEEVLHAHGVLRAAGGAELPICLMQCNTNYTGSLDNFRYIRLRVLETFARVFPETVLGLSDHTPGHAAVLGGVALGARVIEKHFTDDNARMGPDHAFSMNPASWRDMVDRTRELELALGDGTKVVEANERESAVVQRRALYAAGPILRGEALTRENLEALRPAPEGSLTPDQLERVLGMSAPRDYQPGDCLHWADWKRA